MRSPSRSTNGSKIRSASSIEIRPCRTTCGTEATPASGQLALDEAQHVLGVLADLHLGKHAADGPPAVDHEGGPVNPEEFPTQKAFPAIDTVGGAHLGLGIAQEKKRQAMLRGELLVGIGSVPADSEDDGVVLLEVRVGVAKAARLHGATRGRVLGIEIKNEVLPAEEIPE